MTKTQDLLEQVRAECGSATNYKLAKTLGLHRSAMKRMTEGSQQADAYAATRIALFLKRDPLEVIAEIEGEAATTPEKREFWRSFSSGLMPTLLGGALLLTGSFSAPDRTGTGEWTPSHNGRLRQNRRKQENPRPGVFFERRKGQKQWIAEGNGWCDRRRPGRPA